MKTILSLILIVAILWLLGIFSMHFARPAIAVDYLISPETLKTISLDEQTAIMMKLRGMYEPSILPTVGAICVITLTAMGLFIEFKRDRK